MLAPPPRIPSAPRRTPPPPSPAPTAPSEPVPPARPDLRDRAHRSGTATRITSGTGWDQQPRLSPDGKQITFVSDRNGSKNVWIANADGSAPRIITRSERINFASPIWSADGRYVIAARTGQLWMYNTDGGSGVQLTGLRIDV